MKSFTTSLAPMKGLTTRNFMDALHDYGEPTEYISEFLRVHPTSILTKEIVDLIENRKSFAALHIQLLGREPNDFVRIAKLLENYKIQGINLNFGCPIPKIRKKGVGGALLTDLDLIDAILSALLDVITLPISVKTRIGYQSPNEFGNIVEHLSKHKISALYLHSRTVKGMYVEQPDFEYVKTAKTILSCPVIANGDIKTASEALKIIEQTQADGVMIGRSAIANPWIFQQIFELSSSKKIFIPSGQNFLEYIERIKIFTQNFSNSENRQISSMKKYIVPLADFIDLSGIFSYKIRRAMNLSEFMHICEEFFNNDAIDRSDVFN